MVKTSLVEEDVNLVLVGDFNPKIFQPSWFSANDLLRDSEAEKATIEIIHEDVVSFKSDWFDLNVNRNKFTLRTTQEPYAKHLFDLAVGTFRKLIHTPIVMLGINRTATYQFDLEEEWHGFGDYLGPKAAWLHVMEKPGLRSIAMTSPHQGAIKGGFNVQLESRAPNRVIFKINDHYQATDIERTIGCKEMLEALESCFLESQERSKSVPPKLLEVYANSRNS